MTCNEQLRWYPLRVPYCREMRLLDDMKRHGIETFIPMRRRSVERNGVSVVVEEPVVRSLCFVHCSLPDLEQLRRDSGTACIWLYYGKRDDGSPVWVGDREMEQFMLVSRTMCDDVIYLQEVDPKLRKGQRVRVTAGPFEGVEGFVVRIRKNKRVLVELGNMMAVATAYIPPENLEDCG